MTHTDSFKGRIALMTAHCAGMLDLVTLPVWVGTLMSRYQLDPQQAGLLMTLFLLGAVLASLVLAPRFHRMRGRSVAVAGFGLAAVAFVCMAQTADFGTLAVLHALAGVAAGAGLSVTHGTIACSPKPHRLFAVVGIALGIFGIVFMGVTPPLIASHGGPLMFQIFAAIMALAAVVATAAFPAANLPRTLQTDSTQAAPRLPAVVWFAIVGISAMALVQAMAFSFVERVGMERGFGAQAITGVLIALGVVNLFPAALAAMLEKRWLAHLVLRVGPGVQAALVLVIMNVQAFAPYAVAVALLSAVMIFTHTFAFGLMAQLDRSGRALAATPAMLMTGAAIGPILGGTLVKFQGFGSLSVAATAIAAIAVMCFSRIHAQSPSMQPTGTPTR